MGWSIENLRPQIDVIFENEGKRYKMQHPVATSPRVWIQHENEISIDTKTSLTNLFPEMVYIDFFPNMTFEGEPDTKRIRRIK